jgi:site-specific DNA-methyltransferase (adenine-specific)
MKPYFETDLGVLYHGDCLEIMPQLEPVDLVLTDPPYGIDYDPRMYPLYDKTKSNFEKIIGDEKEMDLSFIFNYPSKKIIWGAENFYSQLPHKGRWICWHKRSPGMRPNSMLGGDFELAWMDKTTGFYKFVNVTHGGCINADSIKGNNEKRKHPSQKPVVLFQWCIELDQCSLVLDPFLGSGTTAIACERLNRKWIGIEISEKYCEIAAKRIERERQQLKLFQPETPKPKPEQKSLFRG